MTSIDWKNISHATAAFVALTLAQVSTTTVQAADYDVGSIHITAATSLAFLIRLAHNRGVARHGDAVLDRLDACSRNIGQHLTRAEIGAERTQACKR
jgi:hypothetical protein